MRDVEVFEVEEWTDGGAAGLSEGAEAAALSLAALDRGVAVGVVARAAAAAAASAPAATRDDDGCLLGAAAVAAAAAASSSEGVPALRLLLLLPPPWCDSAAAGGMGGVDERRAANACSCAEDQCRRQGPEPRDGEGARGVGGAHRCAKVWIFRAIQYSRMINKKELWTSFAGCKRGRGRLMIREQGNGV